MEWIGKWSVRRPEFRLGQSNETKEIKKKNEIETSVSKKQV